MDKEVILQGLLESLILQIEGLEHPDYGLHTHYVLYGPIGITRFTPEMRAAVILESTYGDHHTDPRPQYAVQHQLEPVADIDLVQSVIGNAKEQKPTVSIHEIIEALNYYYDFDAFMEFEPDHPQTD